MSILKRVCAFWGVCCCGSGFIFPIVLLFLHFVWKTGLHPHLWSTCLAVTPHKGQATEAAMAGAFLFGLVWIIGIGIVTGSNWGPCTILSCPYEYAAMPNAKMNSPNVIIMGSVYKYVLLFISSAKTTKWLSLH